MTLAAPERGSFTEPLLYRVTDAMRVLSMSRTVIYEQIRTGRLRTVKQGRTRLIPASAITEYVALLEREAGGRK
ncbi:helix-turn-helix domain-containing protein [Streptomyces rimosus]|uniref:helix-turn-helix domain-containing protein n=1 Tax=Streptomyces rimosus TaxID=1927 RepID=UPI0005190D48|nr:helix-turn-helix domain-containing protein [Streptomyces rimosus]